MKNKTRNMIKWNNNSEMPMPRDGGLSLADPSPSGISLACYAKVIEVNKSWRCLFHPIVHCTPDIHLACVSD